MEDLLTNAFSTGDLKIIVAAGAIGIQLQGIGSNGWTATGYAP